MSVLIPLSAPTLSVYLYIYNYLSGYGFATFLMHDVNSMKTCSVVQLTQKPLSVVIVSVIKFVTFFKGHK